jgi:alpha-ketoglutarate-dependent taurine dioxygenase
MGFQEPNKPSIQNMLAGKRKNLASPEQELFKTHLPQTGKTLPLVIEPAVRGVDLLAIAKLNRDFIDSMLLKHGALLFRNFEVDTVDDFEKFIRTISGDEIMRYTERSSPRHEVKDHIYTSTDYPADQEIFPHNEHSYSLSWPMKLYLYCETPPGRGGETPIGDCRKILQRIPPGIRDQFASLGWMYVRNFGDGFGLPWQTAFNTEDRNEVERYCHLHDIQFEWKSGNRLRTKQVRPALTNHPRSGEEVWFNHATFFHITTLDQRLQLALKSGFKEEDLPNNTYYGDGSPIEDEVIENLRQAYLQEMVALPWQKGDLLMIDNMLVAHSRSSYEGQRKILFAMAEAYGPKQEL